eukprot:scaffold159906_cov88-Cyclotella_meneghiniana.AAC.1
MLPIANRAMQKKSRVPYSPLQQNRPYAINIQPWPTPMPQRSTRIAYVGDSGVGAGISAPCV